MRLEPTISTLTAMPSIQMAKRDSDGHRIRKYFFLKSILFIMFANLKLVLRSYTSLYGIFQPKRVKFTNCSQFLSHNFFGLDFHFYVIFLLFGIGQLDNDVLKKCSSKNFDSFSITKSTTEFECELRYCDKVYLYIPNFLQD